MEQSFCSFISPDPLMSQQESTSQAVIVELWFGACKGLCFPSKSPSGSSRGTSPQPVGSLLQVLKMNPWGSLLLKVLSDHSHGTLNTVFCITACILEREGLEDLVIKALKRAVSKDKQIWISGLFICGCLASASHGPHLPWHLHCNI
jgi:hypothetical protein